jgi:hypothetical protein
MRPKDDQLVKQASKNIYNTIQQKYGHDAVKLKQIADMLREANLKLEAMIANERDIGYSDDDEDILEIPDVVELLNDQSRRYR